MQQTETQKRGGSGCARWWSPDTNLQAEYRGRTVEGDDGEKKLGGRLQIT